MKVSRRMAFSIFCFLKWLTNRDAMVSCLIAVEIYCKASLAFLSSSFCFKALFFLSRERQTTCIRLLIFKMS